MGGGFKENHINFFFVYKQEACLWWWCGHGSTSLCCIGYVTSRLDL